jgi:hypothetical protein
MAPQNDSTITILDNDHEKFWVNTVDQGKILIYSTNIGKEGDIFQISMSWDSIDKLKERSKRNIFEWNIRDKSLFIKGKNGTWSCVFSCFTEMRSVDLLF